MTKKINVLIFMPNLHGGGAEKVSVNIMRQLNPNKFNITLLLVQQEGQFIDLVPKTVKVIGLNSRKVILSILGLRKYIIENKPDVLYTTLISSHIAVYLALKGLKTKPKVINRSPNSPKLLIKNNQLNYLWRIMLERAYLNADVVIAQTPEMKEEIVLFHKIPKEKISVMINLIDINTIEQKIKNSVNPFNPKFINVVAAGRLVEQKAFDVLIKSFQHVISKDNRFRLFIIGNDVLGKKDELLNLISSCGMNDYIKLLGFQENSYKFFYHSDLYVLSSRWEGLPNTVLENLYLKKPIIATRCIPFMNKLIEDGQNGLLVDVDDIEGLANKILKYKTINTEYSTIKFDNSEIEKYFLIGKNANV